MPHTILTYSLAITEITLRHFLIGNWAVLIAAAPFIYTGVCVALIKRDFNVKEILRRRKEIETRNDEDKEIDLLGLR